MTFKEMQLLAAQRRSENKKGNVKKPADPCYSRKGRAKLATRRKDYDDMISESRDDMSGYHRPGSGK